MESTSNKIFRGLSTQTIITVSLGVLELVVFSIMSRLLTKSDFGYYAAITGITFIFNSISNAGIGSALIQKSGINDIYMSTAFTLSLLISFSFAIIYFFLSPMLALTILDESMILPLELLSTTLLLWSISSYGNCMLIKKYLFLRAGVIKLISYICSSVIGIVLALKGLGIYSLVYMLILNALLNTILLFTTSVKVPRLKISKQYSKEILTFGGWLTMGVVMNGISGQLDKLLLPKWMSIPKLGAYNRPAGFVSSITGQLNSIFDTVLFPFLSELKDDDNKVKSSIYSSFSILSVFSTIIACLFFFNAELLILIFFGENWLDLVVVFRVISLGILFVFLNTLFDCYFRSLNLVKYGFFIRTYGVFQTLLFIYIGIRFDLIGVASSYVLSSMIIVILKMLVLNNNTNTNGWRLIRLFAQSFRPVILVMIVGFSFRLLLPNVLPVQIFASFFILIIVLVEFLFFPKVLGKEYSNHFYPQLERFKKYLLL